MVLHDLEGLGHIARNVSMAKVKTDAHVIEMGSVDKFDQLVGSAQLVGNILQQDTYAQGLGEGSQVLDGSHRCLKLAIIERFAAGAQVLDQKTERDLFRDFQGSLDLVHSVNPL